MKFCIILRDDINKILDNQYLYKHINDLINKYDCDVYVYTCIKNIINYFDNSKKIKKIIIDDVKPVNLWNSMYKIIDYIYNQSDDNYDFVVNMSFNFINYDLSINKINEFIKLNENLNYDKLLFLNNKLSDNVTDFFIGNINIMYNLIYKLNFNNINVKYSNIKNQNMLLYINNEPSEIKQDFIYRYYLNKNHIDDRITTEIQIQHNKNTLKKKILFLKHIGTSINQPTNQPKNNRLNSQKKIIPKFNQKKIIPKKIKIFIKKTTNKIYVKKQKINNQRKIIFRQPLNRYKNTQKIKYNFML